MHKRKFFNMIMLAIGIIVLFSCEYEKIQYDILPPDTPISYSADIQAIWDGGCVGCHGNGKTPPNLTPEKSYDALVNGGYVSTAQPEQSTIYTCMISGGSMAAYTNADAAAKVLLWIKKGAENN